MLRRLGGHPRPKCDISVNVFTHIYVCAVIRYLFWSFTQK